ncbi:hypothetical protein U9M48_028641 [Paspalum notatum var. saurae]|uniref:Uncharacterized protein n=1 Tax=Paspalum notatum var. saurae TaxID=547442 RepID=A0AAQ3U1M9_PASNO
MGRQSPGTRIRGGKAPAPAAVADAETCVCVGAIGFTGGDGDLDTKEQQPEGPPQTTDSTFAEANPDEEGMEFVVCACVGGVSVLIRTDDFLAWL